MTVVHSGAQTPEILNTQLADFFAGAEHITKENANKDSRNFATQRDLLASIVAKSYAANLLPAGVYAAHERGEIHYHDLDYSPLTAMTNCCLPNIADMLANGFQLGNASIEPPKSIGTAATQITQILQDIAGVQYGGQTVDRIDELLASYAALDYQKFWKQAQLLFSAGYPVAQAAQIVADCERAQRSSLHLPDDIAIPEDDGVDPISQVLAPTQLGQLKVRYAKIATRKAIYDAMETMEYQINSNRVSNGQTPFVTLGFGLGTSWLAREIQRAIFLVRLRGLGAHGQTAIFPKLVFALAPGINLVPSDPNYDLKRLALHCAALRIYPDILCYDNIVQLTGSFKAPMGCRSFLPRWEDPATGEVVHTGRMNLGVVSLNLPRIALEAAGDVATFWQILEQRLEIVHTALAFRIARVREAQPYNAPTLYQYGAFGRLAPDADPTELFAQGRATVSLGYIGLYETTAAFYGPDWLDDAGWDESARNFALQIVQHLTAVCQQWTKEEGYHYSVYATPAESLTDRFNRLDQREFGEVPGITDHDFYTNSFHYPVWLHPTATQKLDFEQPFSTYSTGGFIHYCELPNVRHNLDALEAMWDYAYQRGIGYFGVNMPIDHCFQCDFRGDFQPTAQGFRCPECGNTDPNAADVTKRTCGYLGNPLLRPMVHGRHSEIAQRRKHGLQAGKFNIESKD